MNAIREIRWNGAVVVVEAYEIIGTDATCFAAYEWDARGWRAHHTLKRIDGYGGYWGRVSTRRPTQDILALDELNRGAALVEHYRAAKLEEEAMARHAFQGCPEVADADWTGGMLVL